MNSRRVFLEQFIECRRRRSGTRHGNRPSLINIEVVDVGKGKIRYYTPICTKNCQML
uniref:Uncharacterized protein n=1 Tax=Solanum lycopersicum TaxID=4081 RepID=A0A3Q7G2A8_SOLLC